MKIILLHQSTHVSSIKKHFDDTYWIFYSRDSVEKAYWERVLGSNKKINYKSELTKSSYALRDEFVEWSIIIGKSNWQNWLWWTTRLATRSTAISPLYLYICYIEVLKNLIQNSKYTTVLIISESWELLKLIEDNFSDTASIVKPYPLITFINKLLYKIKDSSRFVLTWSKFILYSFYEWVVARVTKLMHSANNKNSCYENHVIIHTCIDSGCIKPNGKFQDRYYPGLKEYLELHNKKVTVLAWLSNISLNRFKAFSWFRKNKDSFLLPQDYYNTFDCISSIIKVVKSGNLPLESFHFRGINYSILLNREQQLQRRNTGAAYFINYITVFKNLAKQGYQIESFVDTWELKYCEVPSLIAIKQYFPQCLTIGIQHAALIPKLLFANYKTNIEEFLASPHADVGITNSQITKRFLVSEGFPEYYVKIGPAFRYQYLKYYTSPIQPVNINCKKAVLVCLPMIVDSAIELLWKCIEAFGQEELPVSINIKFHPFLTSAILIPMLPFNLPINFKITTIEMEKSLAVTDYLIVAGSAAMIEGLSKNIFTFVLANESNIDLIPADMIDDDMEREAWSYFTTSEELKRYFSILLKGGYTCKQDNKNLFEYSFQNLNSIFFK